VSKCMWIYSAAVHL